MLWGLALPLGWCFCAGATQEPRDGSCVPVVSPSKENVPGPLLGQQGAGVVCQPSWSPLNGITPQFQILLLEHLGEAVGFCFKRG